MKTIQFIKKEKRMFRKNCIGIIMMLFGVMIAVFIPKISFSATNATPAVTGFPSCQGIKDTHCASAKADDPYQCTTYVKQNAGWSVGKLGTTLSEKKNRMNCMKPKIGASGSVVVMSLGSYGHVGLVDKVNNNTITISDRNLCCDGEYRQYDISANDSRVLGFIVSDDKYCMSLEASPIPNIPPVAEAAVSKTPGGGAPYYGYNNPLVVTKGQPVNLYFFADKDVNADGKASLAPNGWKKAEWNTELKQGTPSFGYDINTSNAASAKFGPKTYTFNDAPGTYEYQILRITDQKNLLSNVSRIRITVVAPPAPATPANNTPIAVVPVNATASCPSGNGLYCGNSAKGQNTSSLYKCTNGVYSLNTSCAEGCQQNGAGKDDSCKAATPKPAIVPVAEAAVSKTSGAPYYGYNNPITVTKGQPVSLYFFANRDVNGDGKASLAPDGLAKVEWNTDLNQGTPTFETVINTNSAALATIGPKTYTFNDAPGTYEYQVLRIIDNKGVKSNVSRIRVTVVAPIAVLPVNATTSCPSGNGLYCGSSAKGQNTSSLYKCTNGVYSINTNCSEGCQQNGAGKDDSCKAATSKPAVVITPVPIVTASCPSGNGLYCGDSGKGQNPSYLYSCSNGSYSINKACSAGCQKEIPGKDDSCKATPTPTPAPAPVPAPTPKCPSGNGLYCGDSGKGQNSSYLYSCSNGSYSVKNKCDNGCKQNSAGSDDECKEAPKPKKCPSGNGDYCGKSSLGQDTKSLYSCKDGKYSKKKSCSKGCKQNSAGKNDVCK